MELVDALAHTAAVERLIAHPGGGAVLDKPEWLRRSWLRSAERHRIDPGRRQRRQLLGAAELREAGERSALLWRIAQPLVAQLFRQVAVARYCVVMTDADGIALDVLAEGEMSQVLESTGVRAGSVWTEDFEGTCGIGTALIERVPVLVHRDEHFRIANVALSCSAAPIFDAEDRLVAVLDASALFSPRSRGDEALVFQLVEQTALAIENAFVAESMRAHWRLWLSPLELQATAAQTRLLCFDDSGRLRGGNRLARRTLLAGVRDGAPLHELIDTTAEQLVAAAHAAPSIAVPLRALGGGGRLYGTLKAPQRSLAASSSGIVGAEALPPRPDDALARLGADDPAMRRATDTARRLVDTRLPILLQGETGSGKEVFARAIHASSARRDKPFVAMNCAAIPESLIESELYGYAPGAFTGARSRGAKGRIVHASGGTLFLDEIGDMPLVLQSRLLRVLAEQEVLPLGAETAVPVDLHVVCASHRDLAALVREGRFREDLYYRLGGATLQLPPLRERGDLAVLIRRLVDEESQALGRSGLRVAPEAMAMLQACRWPGNLRQLRHVLRYACALTESSVIGTGALPPGLEDAGAPSPAEPAEAPAGERAGDDPLCARMREALSATGGHAPEAAARLGIPRSTFYRKMRAFGLARAAAAA